MGYQPFQYDARQAMIVAKWQVGVRNFLLPVAVIPYAVPLVLELLRVVAGMPVPQLNLSPVLLIAGAVYAALLLYILFRLYTVGTALQKRKLTVNFSGETVVIQENGDAVFLARNEDILRIDYGEQIVRVLTQYDAGCVPRAVVPDNFLSEMQAALGADCRAHRWM